MYLPFYYERLPWNTTRSMSLCWFIIFTIVLCTEFLSLVSRTNVLNPEQGSSHQWWVSLLGLLLKIVHYDKVVVWHIFFLRMLSLYLRGYSLGWGEPAHNVVRHIFFLEYLESIGSSPEWSPPEEHQFIFCFIFASFDKRVSSIIYKVLRVWSYRVVFLSGTP